MKRIIIVALLAVACVSSSAQDYNAQDYIKKDRIINGVRDVEAIPALFQHQSEGYALSWNYLGAKDQGVDNYYLAIFSADQAAPWNVAAGDKAYLGLALENEYIEVSALMDAAPEAHETPYGTKYSTMAYYLIPESAYDKLYKGFDRFKIDVRVKNSVQITLNVKLPFSAMEHMLMSYLYIMMETGR